MTQIPLAPKGVSPGTTLPGAAPKCPPAGPAWGCWLRGSACCDSIRVARISSASNSISCTTLHSLSCAALQRILTLCFDATRDVMLMCAWLQVVTRRTQAVPPAVWITCLNWQRNDNDPICMVASLQRLADHVHIVEARFVAQRKSLLMVLSVCLLHDAHMGT